MGGDGNFQGWGGTGLHGGGQGLDGGESPPVLPILGNPVDRLGLVGWVWWIEFGRFDLVGRDWLVL